ncbi:MarR family winged helix-turn-helix transcriptional regulator [Saccharospirillum alexandrii]|uniref:MarR family winged helix-turn-helix transcriptional regulator n=1 Tax=Saccharospirillum alexandrii TaxID=2448477 RepID=UPI000FDAFDB5|nr:MarR family transcriptional regulator [Saccharospirillum alexandrii]
MTDNADALPQLKLTNQICHALYSATNALIRAYRPLLEPLDLTYPQYLVMLSLWEEDSVPIRNLVHHTRLDSGTLTPILKRLEQKGLLIRGRAATDERSKTITLTDAGLALKQQAADVPAALVCQTDMTADQALELKALAETLYQQLQKAPR